MVMAVDVLEAPSGKRARLARLCHHLGLLRPARWIRSALRRDLRILAYHRVLTVADPERFDFDLELVSASVEDFRRQMQLVKRDFRPLPLMRAVEALADGRRLPHNAVVVTFDDGYDDNYRNAWPILRELDIPATFFVSTGHIDSGLPYAYDWFVHMLTCTDATTLSLPEVDLEQPIPKQRQARQHLAWLALKRLKTLDDATVAVAFTRLQDAWDMPPAAHPDCRPMTWEQLREMHAAGFEIASHGVAHRVLSKLPQAEMEAELTESRATIARQLGAPASSIAYPVGGYAAFDPRVVQATRRAGYTAACTYLRGTNELGGASDLFRLRRLPVERYMDAGWFATMLTLPELVIFPNAHEPSWEAA